MKIYLAGPMSGIEGYNYPAFDTAAQSLMLGFGVSAVINPADSYSRSLTLEYRDYMRAAIHLLLLADSLVLLEGWETSPGARFEVLLAQRLCLPVGEYFPDRQGLIFWDLVPILDAAEAEEEAAAIIRSRLAALNN